MNLLLLDATIRVSELGSLLLSLAGVAVLVTLVILLVKLIRVFSCIGRVLEDAAPALTETVNKLPRTMEHVNLIAGNLVDMSDDVAEAVTPLMASTAEVGVSAETLLTRLNGLLADGVGIAHNLLHYFDREEREKRIAANSSWSQVTRAASSAYTTYRALKKAGLLRKRR